MQRRERLMATLRGAPVDRPAVCFYELNGLDENPQDRDPFNIYSDPSWKPLLDLTREKTDRIVMRGVNYTYRAPDPLAELTKAETWIDAQGSRFTRTAVRAGKRTLTTLTRRDPDINTVWKLEHPVKDVDDFKAWLDLPPQPTAGKPETRSVLEAEEKLRDTGIVMMDTGDPLCTVSELFSMGDFTVFATQEKSLMHRGLEKVAAMLMPRIEAVAKALPGRLWRIYGPEYASPPYLRPALFKEYATGYVTPMVQAIHAGGGYARVHCHGKLKAILDHIAATGCDGLDPIEPPPQGDVELSYVRQNYGKQMALFANLEITDIENMPTAQFAKKVAQALKEGTEGEGRGFVLMPSACPYGRKLGELSLRNYEEMVRGVEHFSAG